MTKMTISRSGNEPEKESSLLPLRAACCEHLRGRLQKEEEKKKQQSCRWNDVQDIYIFVISIGMIIMLIVIVNIIITIIVNSPAVVVAMVIMLLFHSYHIITLSL